MKKGTWRTLSGFTEKAAAKAEKQCLNKRIVPPEMAEGKKKKYNYYNTRYRLTTCDTSNSNLIQLITVYDVFTKNSSVSFSVKPIYDSLKNKELTEDEAFQMVIDKVENCIKTIEELCKKHYYQEQEMLQNYKRDHPDKIKNGELVNTSLDDIHIYNQVDLGLDYPL